MLHDVVGWPNTVFTCQDGNRYGSPSPPPAPGFSQKLPQPDKGKRDNHYHSTYCTRIRHDPRHRLSSLVEAITIHPLSLSIDHYHRSSLSLMRAKLKLAKLKWTSGRQNGGDCGVHSGVSRSRSGTTTLRELSQTSYEVFLYPHCTMLQF